MQIKKLVEIMINLWQQKIIHRDLKPANIMFRDENDLVVIDLGIARFLDKESLTNPMNMCGPCTPIFAAPEQLINNKSIIDQRTDFFSIGIIIHILFYGTHPFGDNHSIIVNNILNSNYIIPFNDKGSNNLRILIKKMISHKQFNRFKNYNTLLDYINQNWRL